MNTIISTAHSCDKVASSTTRGRVRRQGGEFDDKAAERLPISYAMYSDRYDPSANVKLTPVTIAGYLPRGEHRHNQTR